MHGSDDDADYEDGDEYGDDVVGVDGDDRNDDDGAFDHWLISSLYLSLNHPNHPKHPQNHPKPPQTAGHTQQGENCT